MLEIATIKTAIDYSIHTYATIAIFSVFCFLFNARQSVMAMQKQPRLGNFLESVYDFGKNNKNKRWFKQAISQMGLKEKWITKDQSNNRLVKILIFFSLLLLIIANILIVKCYKGSLEMKKPNWIMNDGM